MHACHRVLGNLVLFKCTTCKNRFVTYHPKHEPEMDLDVTAAYPNKVHRWDTSPPDERRKTATFHKGLCDRCHRSMDKAKDDSSLKGIATGSSEDGGGNVPYWFRTSITASLTNLPRLLSLHYGTSAMRSRLFATSTSSGCFTHSHHLMTFSTFSVSIITLMFALRLSGRPTA